MTAADRAAHLKAVDPVLGAFVDVVGPLPPDVRDAESTFAALAEAVVYQQLSTRAAMTIHGRLVAALPELSPDAVLTTPEEELRAVGLSRAKALSLHDLALRCTTGEVPTLEEAAALDDEELVTRLSAVRGIGRWTAEMFLMFTLDRPDVLPVGDLGVRRGFAVVMGLAEAPPPREVAEHGQRWSPHRSTASRYLWRAVEAGGLPV